MKIISGSDFEIGQRCLKCGHRHEPGVLGYNKLCLSINGDYKLCTPCLMEILAQEDEEWKNEEWVTK